MKEPMTDVRRKQLYRIKKRKRRKQCIRVALRMAVLCFLVLFAVQKTADLLRVDDSDRMEDAEQSYSGQGGKTRTNTEKTWGVFGKADVLTQEDKLHSIEESDEYPDQLKELAEKNSETIDFVYDYPEMKDKKQTIDLSQEPKPIQYRFYCSGMNAGGICRTVEVSSATPAADRRIWQWSFCI